MNNNILLRHLEPYRDESLASYLVRTAEKNYIELNCVREKINVRKSKFLREFNYIKDHKLLERISQLVSIDSEILIQMTLNKYEYLSDLNNEGVDKYFFEEYVMDTKFSKYCPICLREKEYHMINWQLRDIEICLEHQVKLIQFCSKCGRNIEIHTVVNRECDCKNSLIEGEVEYVTYKELIDYQSRMYSLLESIRNVLY
ncbi:TniQ family protein [Geosporobacter ferrireducens]|uniref:TniQ domain-containing protein n=1 Tax=Geosporobacter ferrireducens TaxID=1424294 RepID=A0A1D8GKI6_9FIRM|nr:TniQ family protein [Geosporobacter ferrireducens]AOT71411.1 hypothetical protein Gferi_18890 [Geosporobacter ferrireducens]MTI57716.1 TniQ family protein [Geosporobacter ferrireducens]